MRVIPDHDDFGGEIYENHLNPSILLTETSYRFF